MEMSEDKDCPSAPNELQGQHETLDWSVSAISVNSILGEARLFQPSPAVSSTSSGITTPDKEKERQVQSSTQLKELCHLLDAMRDLRDNSSVSPKHEATVLQNNQPSRVEFYQLECEESSTMATLEELEEGDLMGHDTPRTEIQQGVKTSLDMTPPVRDCPAPSSSRDSTLKARPSSQSETPTSTKKLDEMRERLRELENCKLKLGSASKIPRRTLNFSSATTSAASSIATSRPSSASSSSSYKHQKLEPNHSMTNRSRSSVAQRVKAGSGEDPLVSQLEARLSDEQRRRESVEEELVAAKERMSDLERRLSASLNANSVKNSQLADRDGSLQKMESHLESMREQLKFAQKDRDKMKADMRDAQRQLSACESELERAIGLAAQFRLKLEDNERLSQQEEEELARERQEAEERSKDLTDRVEKLTREKTSAEEELLKLDVKLTSAEADARKAKEVNEKLEAALVKERKQSEKKHSELQTAISEERGRLRGLESSLHEFYQSQMESIIGEKVQLLQQHSDEFVQSVNREQEEEIQRFKREHQSEIDQVKKTLMSDFQTVTSTLLAQKSLVEASLKAAREEADCLREQLRHSQRLSEDRPQLRLPDFFSAGPTQPRRGAGVTSPTATSSSSSLFSAPRVVTSELSSLPIAAASATGSPSVPNNRRLSRPSSRGGGGAEPGDKSHCATRGQASSVDDLDVGVKKDLTSVKLRNVPWSEMLVSNDLTGRHPETSGLTMEEKERILKEFEKQNIEQGLLCQPDVMKRFQAMAQQLLQASFSDSKLSSTET